MSRLSPGDRTVRVVHGATTTLASPPNNAVLYQIYYPARFAADPVVTNTGVLAPAEGTEAWPVVVWFGGVNVNIDGYRWLGMRLADADVAMVTFAHVGETTPGDSGLSPGIDLAALEHGSFGTRPSSTTLAPLLEALRGENDSGLLAGRLDLDDVTLGGHSAGGTMALLNANPDWFPGLRSAVSFAGHTMPAAPLGHPGGTVLRTDPTVPLLLMAGTDDSVIASSKARYLPTEGPHDPMSATFETTAIEPGSAFVEISGAGHLSICHPVDTTSARGFLEEVSPDAEEYRNLIARTIIDFLRSRTEAEAPSRLESLADEPGVARFRLR